MLGLEHLIEGHSDHFATNVEGKIGILDEIKIYPTQTSPSRSEILYLKCKRSNLSKFDRILQKKSLTKQGLVYSIG